MRIWYSDILAYPTKIWKTIFSLNPTVCRLIISQNVVDDHLMGINYVIRGVEYLSSTPKYNLMYDSFGWERPRYMHLSPIMKDAQRKLSKRYGDANFEDFIEKGYLPEAIVNYIALLGWSPKGNEEKLTMEQLIEEFDVEGISKSPSIFDEAKMRWLNGEYVKNMSVEQFVQVAKPFFDKSKVKDKYDYRALAKTSYSESGSFGRNPRKSGFSRRVRRIRYRYV